MKISEVQIITVKPQNGLVAFASCVLDESFYLGSIALHSSINTKLGFRLVFANKKLSNGQIVEICHPINREAELQITEAVVESYLKLMSELEP